MIMVVRAYALLRGAMVLIYSIALVVRPEQVIAGSAIEPARSLGLAFASRTILLGVAFVLLGLRGAPGSLGWLFLADAVLQVFDTGRAVMMDKGAVAVLPAALGLLAGPAWQSR